MDARRFDDFVRAATIDGSRRHVLGALGGGLVAVLLARFGGAPAAAACTKVGKRCAKGDKCCAGARCKGGTCKCKPGRPTCGKRCCVAGQSCLPVLGSKVCVNGDTPLGEGCDPDTPGECASGKCGCVEPGSAFCACRDSDCKGRSAVCNAPHECCRGLCLTTPCGPTTPRCCVLLGSKCRDDCDCCHTDSACHGGTCCRTEGAPCLLNSDCCGQLVCEVNGCAQP